MQHSSLENGRWASLSFPEQMANIGSETYRVFKALSADRQDRAESSFARFQELIDLTIRFGRHDEPLSARSAMWEELCRFRELFCDAYLSGNLDEISSLNRYLDQFALMAKRV